MGESETMPTSTCGCLAFGKPRRDTPTVTWVLAWTLVFYTFLGVLAYACFWIPSVDTRKYPPPTLHPSNASN